MTNENLADQNKPANTDPNANGAKNPPTSNDDDDDEDEPEKLSSEQKKAFDKLLAKQMKLKADIEGRKSREDLLKAENAALKAEKETAETEKLKEQNEFKKLYENAEKKNQSAKDRLIDAELRRIAAAEGIVDDAVIGLIPRDRVKIGDDFTVSGAESAVKAFKAEKPSLFKVEKSETPTTETGAKISSPPPAKGVTKAANELKAGSAEYEKAKREFIRTGSY